MRLPCGILAFILSSPFVICLAEEDAELAASPADERTVNIIETILANHVDPPTRQGLVLAVARAMYQNTRQPVPPQLGREASQIVSRDDALRFLAGIRARLGNRFPKETGDAHLLAALGPLLSDGFTQITTSRESAVQRQLDANRYVGIGIALRNQSGRPVMARVFPGGPASKVGATDGTIIQRIDGTSTRGISLREVVERLRGSKGSTVGMTLLKPGQAEPESVVMTRNVVPFKQVEGWSVDTKDDSRVACLRVSRIAASTAQELQEYDQRIRDEQIGGLVIDLRETVPGSVHHAVLLADQFLAEGPIGSVLNADGTRRTFEAHADPLFDGVPIAILVERFSRGTVEWLAAALQDSGRAVVVGRRTAGQGFATDFVPLPGSEDVLLLPRQILLRRDGTDLRTASAGGRGIGTVPIERATGRQRAIPGAVTPDLVVSPAQRRDPAEPVKDTIREAAVRLLHAKISGQEPESTAAESGGN